MHSIEFDWTRINLDADGAEPLFREVVGALHRRGKVADLDEPLRRLMEREEVQSTAVGKGVALPHARSESFRTHAVVAARVREPFDFGAPDGEPVDLFFFVLGPENAPGDHVRILARLARLLERPGVLDELRTAPDDESFRSALQRGLG